MRYVSVITAVPLLALMITGHAGLVAPTAHSRANCAGFNESITWHLGHSYWWRVESHHFLSLGDKRPHHILNTGKVFTWRAAAYHGKEGWQSRGDHWYVAGYHFFYPHGREVLDATTMAVDCGLNGGWWDH
jgi:hypothetical protein